MTKTKDLFKLLIFNNLKLQFSLLLLIFQLTAAKSQTPGWTWAYGAGTSTADETMSMVTDSIGNIYVAGYFQGPSISLGSILLQNPIPGNVALFVVKFTNNYNALWAHTAYHSTYNQALSISIDKQGNVYLAGWFAGDSLTIDNVTTVSPGNTTQKIFVAKLDNNGNAVWINNTEGGNLHKVEAIACDHSDNIYVTGNFIGTIEFDTISLNSPSSFNSFLTRYDDAGNAMWAKQAGGNLDDESMCLVADMDGGVYTAGKFKSPSFIYAGTSFFNADASGNTQDMFLLKYDSSGNELWAKTSGGNYDDEIYSITSDVTGNILFVGEFFSSSVSLDSDTLFNAGTSGGFSDVFIFKMDNAGNIIWGKRAGRPGANEWTNSIVCDSYNNVYVGGSFWGALFVIGNDTLINTNPGTGDLYMAKFDSSGNDKWAISSGGTDIDVAFRLTVYESSNYLYASGWYYSPFIQFGNFVVNNTNAGTVDMFHTRLGTITGTFEPLFNKSASIYPNPTTGIINLISSRKDNLSLVSIEGKHFNDFELETGHNVLKIGDIPDGIYLLLFKGQNKFEKLVIIN